MSDQTSTRSEADRKGRRRKIAAGILLVVLIVILLATLLGGGSHRTSRTTTSTVPVTTTTTTLPVTTTTPPTTTTTQKPWAKLKIPTKSASRAIVRGTRLIGFSYNVSTVGYGYIAPEGVVNFVSLKGQILCQNLVSKTGSGYCHLSEPLTYEPGTYRYKVQYVSAANSPFEQSVTLERFKIVINPHAVTTTTSPTLPTTSTSTIPTITTTTTVPPVVQDHFDVPSAPQSPVAAFVGGAGDPTSVGVSWAPPATDGGAPISLYSVTDSQGDSCTTTVTSCTFTDTSAGLPEMVDITATNAVGTGPAANTSALLFAGVGLSTTYGTNNWVVTVSAAETNSSQPTDAPLPTGTFTVIGYPSGTPVTQQALLSMYGGNDVAGPSSIPPGGEVLCTITNADLTPDVADLPQVRATANCTIPPSLMTLGSGFVVEYSGDAVYAPSIDAEPWYEPLTFTTDETNPGAFDVESSDSAGLVGAVTFTDLGTGNVICTAENVSAGLGFCPLDLSGLPNPLPESDDEVVASFDPTVGFAGGPFVGELPTTPAYSFLSDSWPSMQAAQYELQCPGGGALTMTPSCPGPLDLTNSTVSIDPTSVPADGVSYATVTVTVADAAGDPISGQSVSLYDSDPTSSAQGTQIPSLFGWFPPPGGGGWSLGEQTNSSGVATFEVRDAVAENVPLTASVVQDTNTLDPDSNATMWSGSIAFTPTA